MMKKILLAILVVICLGGIGVLGYMIFSSRNIVSAEISGNIKTLYVVGDELSFGDAKLKVTYKNGNIKMVDLDSDTVDVAYFTTSVETHATMEITYKSQVIKVEYNVIKKGYHYLTTRKNNTITTGSYELSTTPEMIYIGGRGTIKYYSKEAGKWLLHDGEYDKSYKYTIVGDTMNVNLGSKDNQLSIKADYNENGTMLLKSTLIKRNPNDPDIVISKEEKTYRHHNTNELKVNYVSLDDDYCYSKVSTLNYGDKKVLVFNVGDTFETSANKNLLLKVRYIDQDSGFPIKEAYLYLCNEIIDNEVPTGNVINEPSVAYCRYEAKDDADDAKLFNFYYIVKNA